MGLFGKKDREKAGQFIFLIEQIFSMGQIGIAAVGTVSERCMWEMPFICIIPAFRLLRRE